MKQMQNSTENESEQNALIRSDLGAPLALKYNRRTGRKLLLLLLAYNVYLLVAASIFHAVEVEEQTSSTEEMTSLLSSLKKSNITDSDFAAVKVLAEDYYENNWFVFSSLL